MDIWIELIKLSWKKDLVKLLEKYNFTIGNINPGNYLLVFTICDEYKNELFLMDFNLESNGTVYIDIYIKKYSMPLIKEINLFSEELENAMKEWMINNPKLRLYQLFDNVNVKRRLNR